MKNDKPAVKLETPRCGLDPELQAMAKIDRILAEFGEKEQLRILTWLCDRYREAEIPVPPTYLHNCEEVRP